MRSRAATAMDVPGVFRSKVLIPGDPERKTLIKRTKRHHLPDDTRAAIVDVAGEARTQWASA